MNPFEAIKGKLVTYVDLADFTEQRWLTFLNYYAFFIQRHENSESIRVTGDKMKEMEAYLEIPNHPFHEPIYRMNRFSNDTAPQKFKSRLRGFSLNLFNYIKKHPACVTEDMRKLLEAYPFQMGTCLIQAVVETDKVGNELVKRDNRPAPGTSISLPSVEAMVITTMVKMADAANTIMNTIKPEDLKKLDTKEKLNQATKILTALGSFSAKARRAGNAYTQININASNEDLERANLEFTKKINEN